MKSLMEIDVEGNSIDLLMNPKLKAIVITFKK